MYMYVPFQGSLHELPKNGDEWHKIRYSTKL